MTLDPRTQLAQTMLLGLTEPNESVSGKRPATANNRGCRNNNEQDRQSLEALTQALLDPFTTVQEAVIDSLLQRAEEDSPMRNGKDRTAS